MKEIIYLIKRNSADFFFKMKRFYKEKTKLAIFITIISVLVLGLAITFLVNWSIQKKREEMLKAEAILNDPNVYNVLLVGANYDADYYDAISVLSINFKEKQVNTLAIPYNIAIEVKDKKVELGSVHQNGSYEKLTDAVTYNFKIDVKRYMVIDFFELMNVIDTMGGVELSFTQEEADAVNRQLESLCKSKKIDKKEHLIHGEGTHNCSGMVAISYAFLTEIEDTDYDGTKNYTVLLEQLMKKVEKMSVKQIIRFVKSFLPVISHNISVNEIVRVLTKTHQILEYEMWEMVLPFEDMYYINDVEQTRFIELDWDKTRDILEDFLY